MDLGFVNNQTWLWTVSLSQWALLYDLTIASFAMHIRDGEQSDVVVYEWKTGGGEQGRIDYEPTSMLLIMRGPYADMKAIPDKLYRYDLQMTFPALNPIEIIVRDLARGSCQVVQGVTR